MIRIIGSGVALALIVILAWPFVRDVYHRYQVSHRLDTLMDDRDRAAFRAWNGDAASFGRSLYDRCERSNGQNAAACEPYRLAIQ